MSSNAYAHARRSAAFAAAGGRGGVPSYGTRPAYPMCPQDTSGAGGGKAFPLDPLPVALSLDRRSGDAAHGRRGHES